MVGLIGSIQSMEALRYLAGHEIGLKGRLLVVNGDTMDFEKVKLRQREDCTACGDTFAAQPVDEVCDTRALEAWVQESRVEAAR